MAVLQYDETVIDLYPGCREMMMEVAG
jgi:hypothetical protein